MWVVDKDRIIPLLAETLKHTPPWHSQQKAALPKVYVQNASLEIAWTRVALQGGSIAGDKVIPFFTEGVEGVDINNESDWWYVQHLLAAGEARLPAISTPPYSPPTTAK